MSTEGGGATAPVRHFVLAFIGKDANGILQQGNIRYTSRDGKFRYADVDRAIEGHCKRLKEQGIEVPKDSCMILSAFEVDV